MNTTERTRMILSALALIAWCAIASKSEAQGLSCPISGGNPTCGSSSTSQSSPNPSSGVGNPIDVTTGNKFQREIDIEMPGDLSIDFERYYNSLLAQPGVLGRGWSHTYETRLSRTAKRAAGGAHPTSESYEITLMQADGRVVTFQPFETTPTSRRYRSIPGGYGLIEEDLGALEQLRSAVAANRGMTADQLTVWKWQWSNGRILTFNGRGLIKTIEQPDGRALRVQYDIQRRLTRVTDNSGNWLEAAYWDNAVERLRTFEASANATTQSGGYRGRLKSLTLSSGERMQYQYDARGNLSEVSYADGTTRRYEYVVRNGGDRLAKIIGRDGRLFASYEYDSAGHATASSHPDHRDDVRVSYDWPKLKQPLGRTTVEDAAGVKTVYTWQGGTEPGSPFLIKAQGPGCRSCAAGNVRYDYDANHRVTRTVRVDASGAPIEQLITTIDDLGRTRALEVDPIVVNEIQPPSWRETRDYTGINLWPTTITRPSVVPGREHTLQVEYNERGQPTRITEKGYQFSEFERMVLVSEARVNAAPIERVITLNYVKTHGLSLVRDIDGPLHGLADESTYEYDTAGSLISIGHPLGVRERFERDTWGRVTRHTGIDGVIDTFEYGADSRITRFAHGDTWMTLRYDGAGHIAVVQDSLGQQLTLTRNDAGKLVQIADTAGNRIHWDYGERGEVQELSLLNPDGSLSQRAHPTVDSVEYRGRAGSIPSETMLSSIAGSLPDESAASLAGLQSTLPSGATVATRTLYDAQRRATTYVYDDFGRLTAEHSPVSGATGYRWDESDHLIEKIASDGTTTRITRDALGRAIRVQAGSEDGRLEWGAANRPTRVTFAGGEELFAYDTQGRLTSHTLLVGGKKFSISYEFDALGRTLRKRMPDGTVLHYRYNGPMHPKPGVLASIYKEGLIDRPVVTDLNLPDEHFDAQGFTFGNGLSQRRVLDANGRPLTVGNPKVGQSHLDWTRPEPSATYSRAASVGDSVGEDSLQPLSIRVAASVSEFGNNGFGPNKFDAHPYFMQSTRFDSRGQLLEDSQRRYEWDALGRLTRVTRHENSGFMRTAFSDDSTNRGPRSTDSIIAEYRYNLFGERIAKLTRDTQGTKLTYFLWDGAELDAEMDQNGKVLREYVYLEDRPVALLSGSAIFAIHTDHRMAPIAVTDSSRHVVWQADVGDNGAATVSTLSKLDMPLRASNQYFDGETGFHYNLYRYLDATAGRYLSPDPMGLTAGPDLYRFALGQPHLFVDPLGLQTSSTSGEPSPNTDVSQWSFGQKLTAVFTIAAKSLPSDVAAELLSLVSPKAIATTVGVFAIWGVSHAFGVGEAFDAISFAIISVSLGAEAAHIIAGLLGAVGQINSAKCYSDLQAPGSTVSKAVATVGTAIATTLLLRKIFKTPEANEAVAGARAGAVALPKELTLGNNAQAGVDVYFGVKNGKAVYVGISNNVPVRAGQHGSRFDQLDTITDVAVTRGEARAIEQALIARPQNSNFTNKINSISPNQTYYQQAVAWGEAWLEEHGL